MKRSSYASNAMVQRNVPQPTIERQRELTSTLGVGEPTTGEPLTVDRLREKIDDGPDDELGSRGKSIRSGLSGRLDEALLSDALSEVADQIRRSPQVRRAGIPTGETVPDELYRELVEPAWRAYRHLEEVGFFESVEENLPAFTADHIAGTARELVRAEPLSAALEECGFDERERMVLMMDVTNNDTRLSRWVPTREIPEGVEFDVEYVPPLHQRAMGGALLWIQALDDHLWRKEILITETILDEAYWDTKAMLGGLYLMMRAAHDVASGADGTLSDAQLTATLSASTAVMIVNQEGLMQDAFWITEEKRNPSKASGREEELPWQ